MRDDRNYYRMCPTSELVEVDTNSELALVLQERLAVLIDCIDDDDKIQSYENVAAEVKALKADVKRLTADLRAKKSSKTKGSE